MTETGKTEETADLPLEGSPTQKESTPMESADEPPVAQEGAKSDPAPVSSLALLKTPTSNRKSDADCFKTPDPVTPTSAKKRKRLTPEERSARELERVEKRRKLEEEKQKKETERLEKLKQREAERLRKEEEKKKLEEEKNLERQKKEEERLKKEEERKKIEEERKHERQKKEEERLKKEEERKQKEEERKQKEDERKQKEEEKERERLKVEEKKAKQAKFFTSFFQKSSAPIVHTIENGSVRSHEKTAGDPVGADSATKNSALFNPLPFQIKTDMAVAPCIRRKMSADEINALDSLFNESSTCAAVTADQSANSTDYLKSIKKGKGRTYDRTEIILKDSPEIQILNEEATTDSKPIGCLKWRIKLLQFEENRRPAYWGTWKRKARKVTARRPFTREDEVDYEFDSDDEWEDEPDDGEEIENSGGEADDQEEGGDGEEDEEGWMVPHGYLSDSEREGKNEDLESLKCKEKEFYKSLKEKTMIGFPFIITDDLSLYKIRRCPVFRSVNIVKKRKPRAPRKKPEEKKQPQENAPTPTVAADPIKPVAPVPASKPTEEKRKSQRKRKVVDEKPNPYAKPPSGFLGMELPSDDEEDMDWASNKGGSSSSSSDSDDSEMADDESNSSDDDDLFTPIIPSKSKK